MLCKILRFIGVVIALLGSPVVAHEGRPLMVRIVEHKSGEVTMLAAVPPSISSDNNPKLALGGSCRVARAEAASPDTSLKQYRCNKIGLKDAILTIRYPLGNPAVTTLLLVQTLDGAEEIRTIPPDVTFHRFSQSTSTLTVAVDYARLGIVHILGGIDHLLFVFGLFLLSRDWRELLGVLTGFTIAHSFTLAASTLGWVNLSIAPTEAAIALSIVFVARELLRREDSLTKRFPVLVAFAFGLLHGFGFASVLRDTGLPSDNLFTAMLFFNVGVELGQIAFVTALMLLTAGYGRIAYLRGVSQESVTAPACIQRRIAVYALGTISAMWFLQRTVAAFF